MLVADASQVKELAVWADEWCVSAFLPVHEVAGKEGGDSLRLKNLLRDAENELVDIGMRRPEASRLVAGMIPEELGDRSSEVFHRAGLALFATPSFHRSHKLVGEAPTLVTVARRFHLKPLLRMLEHDLRFFVLAVTRGYAQLFSGDSSGLRLIDVPGLPPSLDDAVQFDDRERVLFSHSASRRGRGEVIAAFHGQGDRDDYLPEDVMRYLRMIDASLNGVIGETDPLVLAGSRDIVALYQDLSSHGALVGPDVLGNPEAATADDLHAKAWEIVEATAGRSAGGDVARFHQLHGTGKASSTPTIVIQAARRGRVETMFVASDAQLWGRFDDGTDEPELHDTRIPGDEDLFDTAAVDAWKAGAAIHVVSEAMVPGGTGVAAVFRY